MHTYFVADIDIWNKWQVTILFASLLFLRVYIRDLQPCSWRATILQISVTTLLQHTCLKLTSSLEDCDELVQVCLIGGWSWNLWDVALQEQVWRPLVGQCEMQGWQLNTFTMENSLKLSLSLSHTHTHTHTHTRRNERLKMLNKQ